ncbi:hypothetical protein [Flavicella sediminum]|uniref:hypothetical protein n=1 Tax=Flavicella sediminum TaxID=2585141 RepID=UPI001123B8BA|nr:hypothetical protein [Flavicella sediminum]
MLLDQDKSMDKLYRITSVQLAAALKRYKLKKTTGIWLGNSSVEKEIDKIIASHGEKLHKLIGNNIESSWNLANAASDAETKDYLKGTGVSSDGLMLRNTAALEAFKTRTAGGFKLSDRVWNLNSQTKSQLESLLSSGVIEGRSAVKMASDLKQYLKEPNRRYRRIRDKETGKLILSNPAKNYHPGKGVYRSSYKNALRLSRNETNIAYRTADFLRVQQMPFVVGVKVNLSNSHLVYDICDELQGKYPKDFKFTGWHPNCLCFTTTIRLPKDKFISYMNTGKIDGRYQVTKIPSKAIKFLAGNLDKIKKSKPYFYSDNPKYLGANLKKEAARSTKKAVKLKPKPKAVIPKKIEAPLETNTSKFIKNVKEFNDKSVKNTLFEFAKEFPENFNGGLKKVSFSKSFRGLMHNSRSYNTRTGTYAIEDGNSIGIRKGTFRMNSKGDTFSPLEDFREALTTIKNKGDFTFNQEYALEAMWHELRHSQARGWANVRRKNHQRTVSMEIINQFCARHTYDDFISKLGGKAIHKTKVIEEGYGYSNLLSNFRYTLNKFGIDEQKTLAFFKDRIQTLPYEDIHDILVKYLKDNNVTDYIRTVHNFNEDPEYFIKIINR